MKLRFALCLLALAPGVAGAQGARDAPAHNAPAHSAPARNANVWDGKAHQPTAADVNQRQREAGVAAPDSQARAQQEDLDRIGKQLNDRAGKDAAVPHTVQPGGVVPVPQSSSGGATSPSR